MTKQLQKWLTNFRLTLCSGALISLCVMSKFSNWCEKHLHWFPLVFITSKHSGQRSIWQAFIVLVAFLLLSDSMSKHICLAVQVICVCVCFFGLLHHPSQSHPSPPPCPCCSQFVLWCNVCQIALAFRSDHWAGVSHGCYGLKALCLKYFAVFVFPGGCGLHWPYSAVAGVVDWLHHLTSLHSAKGHCNCLSSPKTVSSSEYSLNCGALSLFLVSFLTSIELWGLVHLLWFLFEDACIHPDSGADSKKITG